MLAMKQRRTYCPRRRRADGHGGLRVLQCGAASAFTFLQKLSVVQSDLSAK